MREVCPASIAWLAILTDFVSALSRSAQYWSSYSGYLREIRASLSPAAVLVGADAQYVQPSSASHTAGGMILVSFARLLSHLRSKASSFDDALDTAKEIYRNATLRELEVLGTMDARGTQQAQALAAFDGQLQVIITAF